MTIYDSKLAYIVLCSVIFFCITAPKHRFLRNLDFATFSNLISTIKALKYTDKSVYLSSVCWKIFSSRMIFFGGKLKPFVNNFQKYMPWIKDKLKCNHLQIIVQIKSTFSLEFLDDFPFFFYCTEMVGNPN